MKRAGTRTLLVAAVVAAMAWASTATAQKMPASMEVGGASIGGGFYVMAGGIAKLLEDKLKIPVTAAVTEGSRENIRLLDRKQVFMAIVSSSNGYPGYHGTMGFKKKHPIAPILGLYPHAFAYMTLPNSPVRSFADLKGKRVGVGTGRTWDAWLKPLYEAHGLTYKDIKPVYAGMSDLYTQLGDGIIAATPGVVAGQNPIPGALRLHAEKGAAYFGPEPAAVEKVLKQLPYMGKLTISKNTPTFTKDIESIDIGGPHLYVRSDADTGLVYEVTKLLHQNLDNLADPPRSYTAMVFSPSLSRP